MIRFFLCNGAFFLFFFLYNAGILTGCFCMLAEEEVM
jgi:hypothetical protein